MESPISYSRSKQYRETMHCLIPVKKQLTVAGSLSFTIILAAAIADSGLYPPGGRALRRRSLKEPICVGDRLMFRFSVRRGPELGGMGTIGMFVSSKMIASGPTDDNHDR